MLFVKNLGNHYEFDAFMRLHEDLRQVLIGTIAVAEGTMSDKSLRLISTCSRNSPPVVILEGKLLLLLR